MGTTESRDESGVVPIHHIVPIHHVVVPTHPVVPIHPSLRYTLTVPSSSSSSLVSSSLNIRRDLYGLWVALLPLPTGRIFEKEKWQKRAFSFSRCYDDDDDDRRQSSKGDLDGCLLLLLLLLFFRTWKSQNDLLPCSETGKRKAWQSLPADWFCLHSFRAYYAIAFGKSNFREG